MYSSIMLGRILKLSILHFSTINVCIKSLNMFKTSILTLHCAKCHTRYRKKPQHGSRYLTNPDKVFAFNAWYVNFIGIPFCVTLLKICTYT